MRVIDITILDKIATNPKNTEYVCGNSDYEIHFDFDSEWEEHRTKTARFAYGNEHQDVVFDGNQCPVPIISNVCVFEVGVFAGNLRTSTSASVPAKKSILCKAGVPADPLPDVYAQIMEKLNNLSADVSPEDIAQAVKDYLTENPIEGVTPEEVQGAVNTALQEAKDSGEFDGPPGESGVYMGSAPPTDPAARVWIDPDGEADPEGGTVEVDETLSVPGMAADAAAVGKKVAALTEEIGKLGNAGGVSLTTEQVDSCKEYAERINAATGKTENFVFFTDPHFGGANTPSANMGNCMRQIAEVYNNTPTSMCVCGGDWLNNGNTKENACWQLGVFDGQMKALFDRYVLIIGNHDTNYQGKDYMQSGADGTYDRETHEQCVLSRNALVNLWHRKQGASYFAVDGDCTKFYVFDTGLDWYPDMDEYKWEQVDWFANSLLTDKPEQSAALLHIAGYSASNPTPFVSNITQIAKAYNARSSVTLNGKGYDFSAATGKFHFILGGHKHEDTSYVLNDVVIVMTTNLFAVSSVPSFDLVLADYAADKIHMVRVGAGNSRTISLVDGSATEDGDNGDNGDAVETNLFDMGISAADYVTYKDKPVSDSDLIVNTLDGTLTASSLSGGERHLFRTKEIENDGTEFRLQGTVSNEVGKTAFWGLSLRLFDDAGEIVTDANIVTTEKPKYASDFVYADYWKAYRMSFGDSMGGNVADIGMRFTIPANVKTFMLGFQFTTPYQGEAGTPVTFKDIILTKA